jgi:hypothetical protein
VETPIHPPHGPAGRPPLRLLRDFLTIPAVLAVLCGLLLAAVDHETGHIPAALWLTFAVPAGLTAAAVFNWLTWQDPS